MRRRQFISAVGGVTVLGMAGCTESDSNSDDAEEAGSNTNDSRDDSDQDESGEADTETGDSGGAGSGLDNPESAVTSYVEARATVGPEMTGQEVLAELDPVLHSASPVRDNLKDVYDPGDNEQRTFVSVETIVLEMDIEQERLDEMLGERLDQSSVESIAGENATIETTIEFEEESIERNFLVAPEDGDWRVVGALVGL